jgi:hypothetical protein
MPKRKRTTHRPRPSKRPKYADSSDVEIPAPDDLWEAEGILEEKQKGRKVLFLVHWKGRDPQTGKEYDPTWEPEENCTKELVASWRREQIQQASASASRSAESNRDERVSLQPRESRPPLVVESSPEPSTAHTTSILSAPSTPAAEDPAPALVSSAATTPPKRPSPHIHIQRGGSFDPNEYERFSQLAPSQHPSTASRAQEAGLESSQLSSAAQGYHSSGIVPDSQSSVGAGSFVPITQQTTGTTQQSSTAYESQQNTTEEDSVRVYHGYTEINVFADNTSQGLLEIVQQAASHAPSPATSIPETIYDTSAESQSQRRLVGTHEPIEVSHSSQAIDSSSEVLTQQAEFENSKTAQPSSTASLSAQEEAQQQDRPIPLPEQVALPPGSAQAAPELIEVSSSQDDISSQPASQERALSLSSSRVVPPPVEAGPSRDISQPRGQEQQERPNLHRASPTLDSTTGPTVDAIVDESQHFLDSQLPATKTVPFQIEKTQAIEQEGGSISKEQSAGGVDIPSISGDVQTAASQDCTEASLAEHSVLDQPAQFAFHYQQHTLHDTSNSAQPTASQITREEIQSSTLADTFVEDGESLPQTERLEALSIETSAASLVPASSHNAPKGSLSADALFVSSNQTEDQSLLEEYLNPEFIGSPSPTTAQRPVVQAETAVQSTYTPHHITEGHVRRRDFAFSSQTPLSTTQLSTLREQHAQVVPPNNDLSTQEDVTESVRPSVEKTDFTGRSTPDSRHDSSQDSPDRQRSSSPIARPPDYSLDTVSNVPSRPKTPVLTSSLSIMANEDSGKELKRRLDETMAQRLAEEPFIPKQRFDNPTVMPTTSQTPTATPSRSLLRAGASTSATAGEGLLRAGASPSTTPTRSLLRAGISPSVAATEGTRSPSTVPDRVPAPPAPTSLRTIALTQASQALTEETQEEPATALSVYEPVEIAQKVHVPAIVATEPTVPEQSSSDNEDLSDATDDDNASLLNDDLHLGIEEYIVPLFIEGRQRDEYAARIEKDKELLRTFMKDPHNSKGLAEIEELLSYLRELENHFDLVYSEADLAVGDGNIKFALHFGIHNSIKFMFLHALFCDMQKHDKHIVLVTQEDNDRLFHIIQNFCEANSIQYSMPTRGQQADPARVGGNLLVTIFPSTASPIIRPADVIICLDGVQDATQIRENNWAINPDMNVPILHLVISRTVGHIERYLSSSLGKRERIHTILASLAHILGDLGKPIDEDMPRATVAAAHVGEWLKSTERVEWPLGSIGSVKDVIEYQTQLSQVSAASPAPERPKRPHDDEELDPAKRMRLTPQPHGIASTSSNENEITRISDSMPGTAANNTLRAQLARMEEAFEKESSMRRAEQALFREHAIMWDKQQTVHEDLTREYRLLLSSKQELEEKVGTTTKNNNTLRERLATRTTEIRVLTEQLEEQRDTHLLSEDDKIIEITKLRKDKAEANVEKERALKNAKSAEATLEYTKEQYRQAQEAATNSASTTAVLEAQIAKLSHAASGERTKLKSLHFGRQHENLAAQIKNLKAENTIVRQALKVKEDELARAKLSGGRMGVGTRATSATPQPKTRSRAASPMRLSNLRNG